MQKAMPEQQAAEMRKSYMDFLVRQCDLEKVAKLPTEVGFLEKMFSIPASPSNYRDLLGRSDATRRISQESKTSQYIAKLMEYRAGVIDAHLDFMVRTHPELSHPGW